MQCHLRIKLISAGKLCLYGLCWMQLFNMEMNDGGTIASQERSLLQCLRWLTA